jgi:hypothetical protein
VGPRPHRAGGSRCLFPACYRLLFARKAPCSFLVLSSAACCRLVNIKRCHTIITIIMKQTPHPPSLRYRSVRAPSPSRGEGRKSARRRAGCLTGESELQSPGGARDGGALPFSPLPGGERSTRQAKRGAAGEGVPAERYCNGSSPSPGSLRSPTSPHRGEVKKSGCREAPGCLTSESEDNHPRWGGLAERWLLCIAALGLLPACYRLLFARNAACSFLVLSTAAPCFSPV